MRDVVVGDMMKGEGGGEGKKCGVVECDEEMEESVGEDVKRR